MTEDARIVQFKQMAEADPENELGHFSLGKAYLEAGRCEDAVASLAHALELNPKMSKAYQLLGEAYDKTGRRDSAVDAMTRGIAVADAQGDRMPRDAMADSLRQWGRAVPEVEPASTPAGDPAHAATSSTGFACVRCGRPEGALPKPPFKGALGLKVQSFVCDMCWREWVLMGTKVINELSLSLSTQQGQDAYDQHMLEFLQLEGR